MKHVMSCRSGDGPSVKASFGRSTWAPAIQDLERALISSWLIISALSASIFLAALALPERVFLSAGLVLQVPHHDSPCMLCGMTRALVAVANGDLGRALALNRWSIVFLGTVFAGCLSIAALVIRRVRCLASRRSLP
jgi:hypothetical protein